MKRMLGRKLPFPRSPEQGFTLLEIAIAIALLGLAFSTLISVQSTYIKRYATEKDILQASLIAQYMMTMLEIQGQAPAIGETSGDLHSALEDYGYFATDGSSSEVDQFQEWEYTQQVTSVEIPGGGTRESEALRRIDLTVRWSKSPQDTFSLFYFMRSKENER